MSTDGLRAYQLAKEGNYEVLKTILRQDVLLFHNENECNNNLLFAAIESGQSDVIQLVASNTVDLDYRNKMGWTALHKAAHSGSYKACVLLLVRGAKPNIKDKFGECPIHIAASNGNKKIVKLLLNYLADPNSLDNNGWSAVTSAADKGNVDIIKLLISKGALINIQDNSGLSPLHLLVLKDSYMGVKSLMECGANVSVVNNTDIDFSKTKKKKKTKFQIVEIPVTDELDEGFSVPLTFEGRRKKRRDLVILVDDLMCDEEFQGKNMEKEFNYENLLIRFMDRLYQSNPDLMNKSKRLKMVPPSLAKVGSKKISFVNFATICKTLNRDLSHLKQFLENELGTTSSLDQNNSLLLRGRFMNTQIESVLRNYCKAYVLCKTCSSSNTRLEKDCRLLFLVCAACGSRYSVDQQSAGFKAVTTKRAAIRAKAL